MDELQRLTADSLHGELKIFNRLILKAVRLGLKVEAKVEQVDFARTPYPVPEISIDVSDGRLSGLIPGPALQAGSPDRAQECEEVLAAAVKQLISRAVRSGWTDSEVTVAISQLADHEMLANSSTDETSTLLNAIKRGRP